MSVDHNQQCFGASEAAGCESPSAFSPAAAVLPVAINRNLAAD
jgi:hypothetical protein